MWFQVGAAERHQSESQFAFLSFLVVAPGRSPGALDAKRHRGLFEAFFDDFHIVRIDFDADVSAV